MDVLYYIVLTVAYFVAIGFFVFGLDDFVFDLQFLSYLWGTRKQPNLTLDQLRGRREQRIAIFVPAWMEGGIVNRMAEYATRVLEYDRYDIFVGVYPNDPETNKCIDEVCAVYPKIHKVVCPNPGPTSKADCLNAIYHAMRLHEIEGVREYEIIALHDSEDVLHPLTLKVYNYYVPSQFDMGQIPVFPLELEPTKHWIGCTYIDEFCELHLKDMFARQRMGGVVPSAGVGTAFSRRSIDYLSDHNEGEPFVVGNLTEDYFTGVQLKRAGFAAGFITYPVDRVVSKKDAEGNVVSRRYVTEIVAVRENFPDTFWGAVRQRSRWILGIAFQCWELAGWEGDFATRYTLFRDRRAPLVHLINFLGYLLILYLVFELIVRNSPLGAVFYLRPIFVEDTYLWGIILVDTVLLLYRLGQKMYCVKQVFGWKQALFCLPRYPLDNLLNFFATCRAVRMYIDSRFFGKPLVWLKTTHVFPEAETLAAFTASIEDLLVSEGKVTREQMTELMAGNNGETPPMRLLRMNLLDEDEFTEIWSRFSRLPSVVIIPQEIDRELLGKVDETEALKFGALPLKVVQEGNVQIAFVEPPIAEAREKLEQSLGMEMRPCLALPTNIAFARDLAYASFATSRARKFLHETLEDVAPAQRAEALRIRYRTMRPLSDILVDLRILSADECRSRWASLLGVEPVIAKGEQVDETAIREIGEFYCALHQLLPLTGARILVREVVHPKVLTTVSQRLGQEVRLVSDLPRPSREAFARFRDRLDYSGAFLSALVASRQINKEQAHQIIEMQGVIREPVEGLVTQMGWAEEGVLRQTFAEVCKLEPAPVEELSREGTAGLLRPGFAAETGCRSVSEEKGRVTVALSRQLSAQEVAQIRQRLDACAVHFVAEPPRESQGDGAAR